MSIRNLMCQLNSLAEVTALWRGSNRTYDAVLYLRPDVLFNCPFPVDVLDTLQDSTVYIADFHHWHGYNDRFAMGAPQVVGNWGDRCAETSDSSVLQEAAHVHLVLCVIPHLRLSVYHAHCV